MQPHGAMQDLCRRDLEDDLRGRDRLPRPRRFWRGHDHEVDYVDCSGTFGSVLAAGTNGINVNGSGITVNLRGLSINGAVTGLVGINFINGNSLTVTNVNIMNFNSGSAIGILFALTLLMRFSR
jgi:hypothetical protein